MTKAVASLLVLIFAGCASGTSLDEAVGETGIDGPFDAVPDDDNKFDGSSVRGPRVAAGVDTEVWAVTAGWADKGTSAARAAGIAWSADSGLDWEEKFDRWVSSFELDARASGSGQTFVMSTPFGDRSFHAPTLECAEVAVFLRATFASWYHLPFYLQGWDANSRQSMYAGHFGFVNANGQRIGNFPRFRTAYRDYEKSWSTGQAWPSDANLRGRHLGDDDTIAFLSQDGTARGAGAYFDEVFLNKRTGYFMRLLLLYFGSANLADGANTFHIKPEATEAGDLLIHRWQRRGIGHTLPIFRVERLGEDALEISIASGSMPRREPRWEDPSSTRYSFLTDDSGGPGINSDGDAYAALGGGVRRWRTAVSRSGRWQNGVHEPYDSVYIGDTDYEAIAARVARYDETLRSLSPEERRDVALAAVESAREHLRMYPASCAARTRREDAFAELYAVMEEYFGMTHAEVDASYRTLADYVFAELEYAESRTCCWNRSTAAMHGIIMDRANTEMAAAEAASMCAAPTVFRSRTDGYESWRVYVVSMGRGAEWAAWSEDETCAQRGVAEDTETTHRGLVAFCERGEASTLPAPGSCDPDGGDDSPERAQILTGTTTAELCDGDAADWYRVDGDATVVVTFDHAAGDLDVEAVNTSGEVIWRSASVRDEERVSGTGTFFVRVFGYRGATNSYSISVER